MATLAGLSATTTSTVEEYLMMSGVARLKIVQPGYICTLMEYAYQSY